MVAPIKFNIQTDLAEGLIELVKRLDKSLQLKEPLRMYIAGGMATHLYTGARVTTDVDAEFSKRFIVPEDLIVETEQGNMLYLDSAYNSTFALMHEDYLEDAIAVPVDTANIEMYVLSPVDLIVSKIARLSGPDMGDIQSLIWHLRVTEDEIRERAEEALQGYVGAVSTVRLNLADVLKVAREYSNIPAPDASGEDPSQSMRP